MNAHDHGLANTRARAGPNGKRSHDRSPSAGGRLDREPAVYGYVRVSTTAQAEEGESLGAQRRAIEGYAMIHGLKLDRVFVERAVSGSRPLRRGPRAPSSWP